MANNAQHYSLQDTSYYNGDFIRLSKFGKVTQSEHTRLVKYINRYLLKCTVPFNTTNEYWPRRDITIIIRINACVPCIIHGSVPELKLYRSCREQ